MTDTDRLYRAALEALLVLEEIQRPTAHQRAVMASLRHAIDGWVHSSANSKTYCSDQSGAASPVV